MRRLLLLSTFALCLALPRVGFAQDAEAEEAPAEEEAPAQEEAAEGEEGYEPDQRGVEDGTGEDVEGGEDQAAEEPAYEPDQRGVEDSEDEAAPPDVTVAGGQAYALEASSSEGARRGIGFDLQLFGGAGATGLDTFGGQNLVQPDQGGVFGGSFGVSLGLAIGPLTFGPRLSFTVEPAFVLGAIGLDVQVALTSNWIAPTLRLGVSYAFMLGLADPLPSQNAPDGIWTELGIGVRARVGGPFLVGGEISGGWLALFRGEVPDCTDPCTDGDFDLTEGGSSQGATFRLHVYGGLSF